MRSIHPACQGPRTVAGKNEYLEPELSSLVSQEWEPRERQAEEMVKSAAYIFQTQDPYTRNIDALAPEGIDNDWQDTIAEHEISSPPGRNPT